MKQFAVIGLGTFGYYIAKSLFEDGNEVIAIDSDKNRVQLVDPYVTQAIVLEATDKEALKSLGFNHMDGVIVCTGTKISTSIMVCLYLNEIGVKRILVKAQDDDHEKILRRVGATDIIHPERDMAIRLAHSLSRPNVLDFIPLGEDYDLVQVEPTTAFIGKSIKKLNLREKYHVHIIAIKQRDPDNFILVPSADHIIRKQDSLLILGKSHDIGKIKALK